MNVERITYIWSVSELAVPLLFVLGCHCPVFCDRKRKESLFSAHALWVWLKQPQPGLNSLILILLFSFETH